MVNSMQRSEPWHGHCQLQFETNGGCTRHQGGCRAPFKLLRAEQGADGRCELPILHTAGGLVGGDQLSISLELNAGSRGLVTSVAAQKVYGSVGRFRNQSGGRWARQQLRFTLADDSWLEWMPQELVLYAGALLEQRITVHLAEGAGFLASDVVRLGRSAAGEDLGEGCWRSRLEICRRIGNGRRWELADAICLDRASLRGEHGMAGQPVFGSLVWVAPSSLGAQARGAVLEQARHSRGDLAGTLSCGALECGLIARYRGDSSQAARFWFTRIWAAIRQAGGHGCPEIPRVWPFQEQPLRGSS